MLDGTDLGPTPERVARHLFGVGVDWIQLRDRTLESDELYGVAVALVSAARSISGPVRDVAEGRATGIGDSDGRDIGAPRVLINRRVDVALAAGADGVHLGFDAIDAPSARELLGNSALIGASLHSADEVERVMGADAGTVLSYAHLAPIWDPKSKPATRAALGLDELSRAAAFGLPLIAQGGVDAERSGLAIRAGASGVAVTGLLTKAEDPTAVAEILRKCLDRARLIPQGGQIGNQSPPAGDTKPMS